MSRPHRSQVQGHFHAPDPLTRDRVFDQKYDRFMVRVLPGDFYVTGADDELVVTVLGSCVAACVRDPTTGFGGMNHFMLPQSASGDWNGTSSAMRYGNFAMEALINMVLKSGARRSDLEIKLFGGANLMAGPSMIGSKNAEFARNYLHDEGLTVVAEDLEGPWGRRIHYSPTTGKVQRLLLQQNTVRTIAAEESRYEKVIAGAQIEGDIEIFN